jgi:hypothetical protein
MSKEVYIVKSAVEYLAENIYHADKIFVDCFELYSDSVALLTKKETQDLGISSRAQYEQVSGA